MATSTPLLLVQPIFPSDIDRSPSFPCESTLRLLMDTQTKTEG